MTFTHISQGCFWLFLLGLFRINEGLKEPPPSFLKKQIGIVSILILHKNKTRNPVPGVVVQKSEFQLQFWKIKLGLQSNAY